MAVSTLVPLEEYQHTVYEPDMEYVDGVLVRRNAGTQSHGLLQSLVVGFLLQLRKEYGIQVFTETRLLLDAVTARHRIPDVMIVEKPYTKGRVVTDVPAAVIEIMSPDDTLNAIFEKCFEYAAFGITNTVVLDPDNRRQYRFVSKALQLESISSLHLRKRGLDLPFPADSLFQEIAEEDLL